MTTSDPEELPLPDHDLLDLHQQFSCMTAEVDDSYDEDRHKIQL